jgi:hypothetical protein
MRLTITALACAAALAGAIGCGQSEEEKAREVAQDYVDARNDGDHDAVCDLYSEGFKQQLAVGDNCPAFVAEQTSGAEGELSLVDVHVSDDRGTADVDVASGEEGPSRIVLTLEREDGDWRISGF